ncbi:hypothetical protein WSS_A11618 [Rhodococcus opacus M213]|uniref:Uncharacterized protein n=1 Tax=Rhodococcus opacus M213 TaxID=1129896 RepID=K8XWE0_RHOOP|nr:hypothetical protein WSS_A11618 [Rhodococcus opacus M213]
MASTAAGIHVVVLIVLLIPSLSHPPASVGVAGRERVVLVVGGRDRLEGSHTLPVAFVTPAALGGGGRLAMQAQARSR